MTENAFCTLSGERIWRGHPTTHGLVFACFPFPAITCLPNQARTTIMKAQVKGVASGMSLAASQGAMVESMGKAGEVMGAMNKQMDPMAMAKILSETPNPSIIALSSYLTRTELAQMSSRKRAKRWTASRR